MRGTDKGAYERIAATLHDPNAKRVRIARIIDGKLRQGTASLHQTEAGRRWRLFWRLKHQRAAADARLKAAQFAPLFFDNYDDRDDLK